MRGMRRKPHVSERRRRAKPRATAFQRLRDLVRLVARSAARRDFRRAREQAETGTGAEDAQEEAKPAGDTAPDPADHDPE